MNSSIKYAHAQAVFLPSQTDIPNWFHSTDQFRNHNYVNLGILTDQKLN